ncbi:MAG: twin transmembrane helix small protein [Rhodocyclaceae bacterium]|nr:twin transmembrane helix small protein [Rhodocyclaceae bacterium]
MQLPDAEADEQQDRGERGKQRQNAIYTGRPNVEAALAMQTPAVVKLLIVIALLAVVASLGVALLRLVRDRGESTRMVKALTFRIVLSIVLFLVLMFGVFAGVIVPHGVIP